MKIPTYQFVAQLGAVFTVAVSLGFVAYELKLSRDIAKADVYQQRIALDQNVTMHLHDGKAAWKARIKYHKGQEPLSKEEIDLMVIMADLNMSTAENVFYQYQLGLLDEEEWLVWRSNMEWMVSTPCYRSFFESVRSAYRKDFAAEIDGLYLELAQTDCPLDKQE